MTIPEFKAKTSQARTPDELDHLLIQEWRYVHATLPELGDLRDFMLERYLQVMCGPGDGIKPLPEPQPA